MSRALPRPAPGESRRQALIALNAAPALGRSAICKLALDLDLWSGEPPGKGRRALAARLGVSAAKLEQAVEMLRRSAAVAEREQDRAAAADLEILTLGDPGYPAALLDLTLPPPVLYCRGSIPERPGVAIVGSRQADPYGLEVAGLFARELAARGAVVVSGFARGVDTAAHEGALEAPEGRTVAVLGCGPDVGYPRHSSRRAARVAARGAVITEFPFGTWPQPFNFPIRNRIIAALAAGTLVVRATPRSGSLITARLALELGRDVYAVPGNIFDERALGPNALIRDGALLAQHPRDILESLPARLQDRLLPFEPRQRPASPPVARALRPVLEALPQGELAGPEEVAERTGLPIDSVLAQLLELELGGWVRRYPGPSYCRKL